MFQLPAASYSAARVISTSSSDNDEDGETCPELRSWSAPSGPVFSAGCPLVASAPAQQDDSAPVTCTQFLAWSAGEMSSQRLNRLVHERGTHSPWTRLHPSRCQGGSRPGFTPGPAHRTGRQAGCFRLSQLTGTSRRVDSAEEISGSPTDLAESDRGRSNNAALHFAMG